MSGADICRTDEERKVRYVERQERKQNERNALKMAERMQSMEQCLDVLRQLHTATVRQVGVVLGKNHGTVKKWMQSLHEQRRIYISDTFRTEGTNKPVPAYSVGSMPDVKKTVEKPEDDDSIVSKRHEEWKRTWTPHCDIAAAWMMEQAA